jgi:DNA-binding NarL/FixJ family response regulator
MSPPLYSEKKNKKKSIGQDDSFYTRPNITLLDEENWAHIENRYHMSARELQVAKLVCRGFSNDDIADELKIKNGTAKTHLRNIYRKIRVKNKIALLLKVLEQVNKISYNSRTSSLFPVSDIEKFKQPSVHPENMQL